MSHPEASGEVARTSEQTVQPSRRGRRWIRHVASTALLVAAVWGTLIYGFPPAANTSGADLVFVLGPPTQDRIDAAQALLDSGVAHGLVSVSAESGPGKFTASELSICSRTNVDCLAPETSTTKGEAEMLDEYARDHELSKVVVITFKPHVARARYIFDRCSSPLDVEVVGTDRPTSAASWAYQFLYQSAAFAKALTTSC